MDVRIKARVNNLYDRLRRVLIAKNEAYGNSVYDPVRYAAHGLNNDMLIRVRIDDKLARIRTASGTDEEDALFDLMGYLALYYGALLPGDEPTPMHRIEHGCDVLHRMAMDVMDPKQALGMLLSMVDMTSDRAIDQRLLQLSLLATFQFILSAMEE